MHSGQFVFSQVVEHVPMKTFRRCVQRCQGNRHIQSFTCLDQFLCMAFAQLTYRESLRDIEIREAVVSDEEPPSGYESFRAHPLASWIESTFGVRKEADTGRLIRQTPRRLGGDGEPEAARHGREGPDGHRPDAPDGGRGDEPDGSRQPSAAA